jgi:pimeloyl-ACP methyl ester carboxylesterase
MARRENSARVRPVTIIGHSLGGVLGRAIAAETLTVVSHAIALGSLVRDGWTECTIESVPRCWRSSRFGRRFPACLKIAGRCNAHADWPTRCSPTPERSRFSAIYTRRDEIVQWKACIDDAGTNFEVSGLHARLIVNREVYRILGSILAEAAIETAAA